jgi:hypothetical protein
MTKTNLKGPRKTHLRLFSFKNATPKQIKITAELAVLMNGLRRAAWRAQQQAPGRIQNIPLSKYDRYFKANTRDKGFIRAVISAFFTRSYRGNNVTKLCSGWAPRSAPTLNKDFINLLLELHAANKEHIQLVQQHVRTKSTKNESGNAIYEVNLVTSFRFSSSEQADLFATALRQIEVEVQDDERTGADNSPGNAGNDGRGDQIDAGTKSNHDSTTTQDNLIEEARNHSITDLLELRRIRRIQGQFGSEEEIEAVYSSKGQASEIEARRWRARIDSLA